MAACGGSGLWWRQQRRRPCRTCRPRRRHSAGGRRPAVPAAGGAGAARHEVQAKGGTSARTHRPALPRPAPPPLPSFCRARSWCGCNNSALFAELVPEQQRSTIYAFDRSFEVGAPLGYLSTNCHFFVTYLQAVNCAGSSDEPPLCHGGHLSLVQASPLLIRCVPLTRGTPALQRWSSLRGGLPSHLLRPLLPRRPQHAATPHLGCVCRAQWARWAPPW